MLKKMELKEGVGVFTPDGKEVGKINRFVLNPVTNEVSHIVVQKGWLSPIDKVVPLQMINFATEERVVLTKSAEEFEDLPAFEEKHFIRASDEDIRQAEYPDYLTFPAYYWYPPQGYGSYPAYGLEYYLWPSIDANRNIPEDAVPLKEGAKVISSDDKHVGDVERLFIDPDSSRATHFVITQGLFFKEHKLVPIQWVRVVQEEKIELVVSSELLERLPAYEA